MHARKGREMVAGDVCELFVTIQKPKSGARGVGRTAPPAVTRILKKDEK